jgi:Ca2+-binding EF-hand superfamily protein
MRIFKQADANRDGKVSFDELKAAAPEITQNTFDDIDKNGDGFITKDEVPKGPGPKGQPGQGGGHMKTFYKADADKDGKVSYEELNKVAPEISKADFDAADANSDGVITKNEVPRGGRKE